MVAHANWIPPPETSWGVGVEGGGVWDCTHRAGQQQREGEHVAPAGLLSGLRVEKPQRGKHSANDLNKCDTLEETNHYTWGLHLPFNLTISHFPGFLTLPC